LLTLFSPPPPPPDILNFFGGGGNRGCLFGFSCFCLTLAFRLSQTYRLVL
jgi:hypothetical protein